MRDFRILIQRPQTFVHGLAAGERPEGGEGGGMDVLHAGQSLFISLFKVLNSSQQGCAAS